MSQYGDFRPISLITFYNYPVISKIHANILKPLLAKFILLNQTVLMKGK